MSNPNLIIMPLKQLTFFVLTLCLLASCNKSNGNNAKANRNRLKMLIETDSTNGVPYRTDTSYITYDNDNRLTSVTDKTLKIVYAYQSKTATLDAYLYGRFSEHELYYLNSAYTIDSSFGYFAYNNTIDTATDGYRYNGGLLTTKLGYSYSSYATFLGSRVDFTYDNDGNLIKEADHELNGYGYDFSETISTFTYTSHPVNVISTPAFEPQQAKYLPATEIQTLSSGVHLSTSTFAYTFDSLGRLITETMTVDNGYVGVTTYVYE